MYVIVLIIPSLSRSHCASSCLISSQKFEHYPHEYPEPEIRERHSMAPSSRRRDSASSFCPSKSSDADMHGLSIVLIA